jgi:hypothetical protein
VESPWILAASDFDLGTVPSWGLVVVAVASAAFALLQLRGNRQARRVDRVIQLHESLTGGEVGAARDRFTTLMWRFGDRKGPEAGRPHQPTFEELLGAHAPAPPKGSIDLARYPGDLAAIGGCIDPLQDLYKVLWCFERIDAARTHETLDSDLLVDLIGFHAAWWDRLLDQIGDDASHHRRALRDLATYCRTQRPDLDQRVEHGHRR